MVSYVQGRSESVVAVACPSPADGWSIHRELALPTTADRHPVSPVGDIAVTDRQRSNRSGLTADLALSHRDSSELFWIERVKAGHVDFWCSPSSRIDGMSWPESEAANRLLRHPCRSPDQDENLPHLAIEFCHNEVTGYRFPGHWNPSLPTLAGTPKAGQCVDASLFSLVPDSMTE